MLLRTSIALGGWDSISRIYFSSLLVKNFTWMPSVNWLPLHFHILAVVFKFTNEFVFSARIVNVVFGSLTVFPCYLLAKHVFGKQAAFFSVFFLAAFPLHVHLSVTALSSVIFLFFLLWSFYFFFLSLQNQRLLYIVFSSVLLAACALIRFEAWMIFGFLFIIGVFSWRNYNKAGVFFIISSLPIGMVMYVTFLNTGDPFYGIRDSDRVVLDYIKWSGIDLKAQMAFLYEHISLFFCNTLACGILISALWSLGCQKRSKLGILLLCILCVTLYKLLNCTLSPQQRYLIVIDVIALVLFAGFLAHFFVYNKFFKIIRYCIFFYMLILFTSKINNIDYCNTYLPKGLIPSAVWAKSNIIGRGKLIADEYECSREAWKLYSGISNRAFYHVTPDGALGGVNLDSLQTAIEDMETRYILLAEDGAFRKYFYKNYDFENSIFNGLKCELLYENNLYEIYRILDR